MAKRMAFPAVLALLLMTSAAAARSAPADPPRPGEGGQQGPIDVTRIPINLERIQRELRQSSIKEDSTGLNIRYIVDVYGQAPPIVIFGPQFDLLYGPVPNSAPTHKEMIEHVTPREYRAPAADFSALLRWLAERSKR